MSVHSGSGEKPLFCHLSPGGIKEILFFFSRHPSGYKLLDLVLIDVDKLEVDPILDNPCPNIKSSETFYSKYANDKSASKCRTFGSYSSLILQFKCFPPLK